MTIEAMNLEEIGKAGLVARASALAGQGCRLVQICCTYKAGYEITYTFEKDQRLTTLRVRQPESDPEVPSITDAYLCAFTYENEMHDLFGLQMTGMAVDFKGTFYRVAVPAPFKTLAPAVAGPVSPPPKGEGA